MINLGYWICLLKKEHKIETHCVTLNGIRATFKCTRCGYFYHTINYRDFLTRAYIRGLQDGRNPSCNFMTEERLLRGETMFSLQEIKQKLIESFNDLKGKINYYHKEYKMGYDDAIETVKEIFLDE